MVGLGTLEEHHFSGIKRLIEQHTDIDDMWSDSLCMGEEMLRDLRRIDLSPVVDLDQQMILLLEGRLDLLAKDRLIEQVLNAQADPVDLVRVRRADAASRRADPGLAEKTLGDLVDHLVIGGDDVGVCRNDHV